MRGINSKKKTKIIHNLVKYKKKLLKGNLTISDMDSPINALILEREYNKEENWSKKKMQHLANRLNLKESQVYKWHWDRKEYMLKKSKKFQK